MAGIIPYKQAVTKGPQGKPLVIVTTPQYLEDTLRGLRVEKKHQHLTVVVSGAIGDISLHVHSGIRTLKIVHSKFDDPACNNYLFVNGSSTLAGMRLDEWGTKRSQSRLLKKHAVLLGKHVKIRVDPNMHPGWAKSAGDVSDSERDRLRRHVKTVQDFSKGGATLRDCRAAISAIAGVAVGTTKLIVGLKGMAGGVAFQMHTPLWGVKVAAFGLKASAVASVAGPAILLGAATAALVYIITWDSFWDWFKGFVARLWQMTVDFLGWLCSWVRRAILSDSDGHYSSSGYRPRHPGLWMG